ncbi:hypothetical protein HWV23_12410 [Natronomonas halophila]|uniref:hypothetical protein n=1 Tax=Natronomonas halophila TaxID=2747817 RepID=UPI0015B4767D|nr:hypothetical protein [Natronomonas halophila]QLD86495.1 hypothetical protein HWV23_12410 [Natronomonas halophila]
MEPRIVGILSLHVVGAVLFGAVAVWNLLNDDPVNAVLQGVLAALIVVLGIGIARSA